MTKRVAQGIDAAEELVERQTLVLVDEEDVVATEAGDVEQAAQVGRGMLEPTVAVLVLDDLERRTGRDDPRTRLIPTQCHVPRCCV